MKSEITDRFLQGTSYYSHANPREELERNFKKIKALGIDAVRVAEIWPGWSVIERREGKYEYDILDDYVDKAVKNGLNVCMGIGINDTPFWLFSKYPGLRFRNYDGTVSNRRVQSACIDHKAYRNHMKLFVENIVQHYKDRRGIIAWQFGNEVRYGVQYCDCDATRKRFRDWLKKYYREDLEKLNNEWGVYYGDWDEIYPYKSKEGPPTEGCAPHCLRFLEFKRWSLEELIQWGVNIVKKYSDLPVFHNNYGRSGASGSHWKLAQASDIVVIDIYATTYDNPGLYNGFMVDMASSIARQQNKPFWIGETSAGQYGTYSRNYVDQKLIENCVVDQIGGGASAIFYFRYKAPVWEQPHKFTGSQTLVRVDESEMEYVKTPRDIGVFMKVYGGRIRAARPVDAKVGIYYPMESIEFGEEAGYFKDALDSAFGAGAIWSGIQIPVEIMDTDALSSIDLSKFRIIHIPVSYLLPSKVGTVIKKFVEQGGVLIVEGRAGYVNENGLLYKTQPGGGIDELIGAKEDLFYNTGCFGADIVFSDYRDSIKFPVIKQTFRLTGGKPFILTNQNDICGVHNVYGKGIAYAFGCAPSLQFRIGSGKYESGPEKKEDENTLTQQTKICKLFRYISSKHGVFPSISVNDVNINLTARYLESRDEFIALLINYNKRNHSEIDFGSHNNQVYELTIKGELPVNKNHLQIAPMSWKAVSLRKGVN